MEKVAVPGCPYTGAKDLADIIKKTGIEVVVGTHDYH